MNLILQVYKSGYFVMCKFSFFEYQLNDVTTCFWCAAGFLQCSEQQGTVAAWEQFSDAPLSSSAATDDTTGVAHQLLPYCKGEMLFSSAAVIDC